MPPNYLGHLANILSFLVTRLIVYFRYRENSQREFSLRLGLAPEHSY